MADREELTQSQRDAMPILNEIGRKADAWRFRDDVEEMGKIARRMAEKCDELPLHQREHVARSVGDGVRRIIRGDEDG